MSTRAIVNVLALEGCIIVAAMYVWPTVVVRHHEYHVHPPAMIFDPPRTAGASIHVTPEGERINVMCIGASAREEKTMRWTSVDPTWTRGR